MLLNLIAGHDERDTTSENMPKKDYTKAEIPIYDPIEFWNLLKNDDVNDIY